MEFRISKDRLRLVTGGKTLQDANTALSFSDGGKSVPSAHHDQVIRICTDRIGYPSLTGHVVSTSC